MSDYLAQRGELLSACLRLAELGYLASTGGNLAVRLDAEHFAITPCAADYYRLTLAQIAVLRLDTLERVGGELPPSVETGLRERASRVLPAAHPLRALLSLT